MVNQTKDVFLKSHMKPPVTKIIFKSNSEPKVGQRRMSLKGIPSCRWRMLPQKTCVIKTKLKVQGTGTSLQVISQGVRQCLQSNTGCWQCL